MDIFVRNITYAATEIDVLVALEQVLHRAPFPINPKTNFLFQLFLKKDAYGREHRGMGLLTLPYIHIGQTFLRSYGSAGLDLRGRTMKFQQSRNPLSQGIVEDLLSTVWEDPMVIQEAKEQMAKESEPISVLEFSFGRFRRDQSFSAEIDTSGTGSIACELNLRRLKLAVGTGLSEGSSVFEEFAAMLLASVEVTFLPNQIKRMVAYPSNSVVERSRARCVFIEFSSPPTFQKRKSFAVEGDVQRSFSLQGKTDMPPGCNALCITFRTFDEMGTFLDRCTRLSVRVVYPEREVSVIKNSVYSQNTMTKFHRFLLRLDFGLAFQVEKSIVDSVLEPGEVLDLTGSIDKLIRVYGNMASTLYRYFFETLKESFRELPSRRRRRRYKGKQRSNAPATVKSLSQRLDDAVDAYFTAQSQIKPLAFRSKATYLSYSLIITPSARHMVGPLPDQSNSVLRRFGNHDCFLRVSFRDENQSQLRRDPEFSISELLRSRYRPLLTNGLTLAGRSFEFLGYSMSGLRDHAVWFVNPFDYNGVHMNANSIRSALGDFTKLARQPARLAARWSQNFSGTDPSINLEKDDFQTIDDRVSPIGSIFTDGCGTISEDLMADAWSTLRNQRGLLNGPKTPPSCFQFRLQGAKGVVVVDPNLSGRAICLRPSQTKFIAEDVRSFDIQATSSRPRLMYLNRPMIVILEHLGVPEQSILSLQDRAIFEVQSSRTSFVEASKLFSNHGLGASYRLPSLLSNLKSILGFDLRTDTLTTTALLRHDLINESIRCACTHALREIKYRAHILVPGSFTLLGVSDEWGCLREGEIYATIFDERTRISQAIEGKVLITRSPQVHPGDVQFVNAVRRPELDHLRNVVVFSCEGERSLPSMLAGGDLDGDDYNLILDPSLHPIRTASPGEYKSAPDKKTAHACTVADVADFVLDYIESDLLGYISIMHLRWADFKDPGCAECISLAELASHAVDFPKTGTKVAWEKIPAKPQEEKPDFLSNEGDVSGKLSERYYRSQKVLGQLFRRVPIDNAYAPSSGTLSDTQTLRHALRRSEPLGVPSEKLTEEMGGLLEAYCDQIMAIARAHTVSKHADARLTEQELVSGTIMARWADQRKRRDASIAMNMQTQQLTKAIRTEFMRYDELEDEEDWDLSDYEDDDDDDDRRLKDETLRRAWAAWNVAEEAFEEDKEAFGPLSFGLIALGFLLEIFRLRSGE